MARLRFLLVLCGLAVALAGCNKVGGGDGQKFSKEMPDLGSVKVVEIDANGIGPTRNAAILDALNLAAQETNGTPIVGVNINSNGSLATPDGKGDFGITNDTVTSLTKGVVKTFRIDSADQQGDHWTVKLHVSLNKYESPNTGKLPKVVIAAPHTLRDRYVIGDQVLSAPEASEDIRSAVMGSINDSKRFVVINRSLDQDADSELAHASDGNAGQAELAKLGQRITADIIIIPKIDSLNYVKHSRILRYSGRSLNSYDGAIELTFNVVNVATGQLVLSKHYSVTLPDSPPSVYNSQKVGVENIRTYLSQVSNDFTRDFILKNFPVSVIKLDGRNVVLSQGQPGIETGQVYQAVLLGDAVTDPQTGQSLGRLETPVGTVSVTKATDTLAMATLNTDFDPAKFKPGIIELRDRVGSPSPAPQPPAPAAAAPSSASPNPPPGAVSRQKASKKTGLKDKFDEGFEPF